MTRVFDEQHRANLVARGIPETTAAFLLAIFTASRNGEFAAVDPALEKILARPPRTVGDVLAESLNASDEVDRTAHAGASRLDTGR